MGSQKKSPQSKKSLKRGVKDDCSPSIHPSHVNKSNKKLKDKHTSEKHVSSCTTFYSIPTYILVLIPNI